VLEPGDAVDRLLVAGRVLVSLSSGGKYLRGWSLKDGTLLWEAVTYTAAAPSAEAAKERGADRGVDLLPLGRDADGDGAEDVLVLARGEVQMRSLSDGVIAWTAEAATRCDDERGDAGDDVGSANARRVRVRSEALMPVVIPVEASTLTVYAVFRGSSFTLTMGGKSRAVARSAGSGAHR